MPDRGSEQKHLHSDDDTAVGDLNTGEKQSAGASETPSNEELQRVAAEQTASTSENADKAGKDPEEGSPAPPAP